MICTFFGHRDCPQNIVPELQSILIDLIEKKKVNMFYVGNDGNFDRMVKKTLKRLKNIYPFITYYVVLAYLPCINKYSQEELNDTVFPDGLKKSFTEVCNSPKKYADDLKS